MKSFEEYCQQKNESIVTSRDINPEDLKGVWSGQSYEEPERHSKYDRILQKLDQQQPGYAKAEPASDDDVVDYSGPGRSLGHRVRPEIDSRRMHQMKIRRLLDKLRAAEEEPQVAPQKRSLFTPDDVPNYVASSTPEESPYAPAIQKRSLSDLPIQKPYTSGPAKRLAR